MPLNPEQQDHHETLAAAFVALELPAIAKALKTTAIPCSVPFPSNLPDELKTLFRVLEDRITTLTTDATAANLDAAAFDMTSITLTSATMSSRSSTPTILES